MPAHRPVFNIILLQRSHIQKLVEQPKILRDKIVVELSRLQAFRTREVATLRWEHINEADGWIWVSDSKKRRLIPVPLDWRLTQLLMQFREEEGGPEDDWVIKPLPEVNVKRSAKGKPISNTAIEGVVKECAREAGIPNWSSYTPTLLRAYFAAEWTRQRRSLKMLQAIMRHNTLEMTMHYVSRIIFLEELQAEFERIQTGPFERKTDVTKMLENPVVKQCLKCPAKYVCKYVDQAVESEWAAGCRFYRKIMEQILEPPSHVKITP